MCVCVLKIELFLVCYVHIRVCMCTETSEKRYNNLDVVGERWLKLLYVYIRTYTHVCLSFIVFFLFFFSLMCVCVCILVIDTWLCDQNMGK